MQAQSVFYVEYAVQFLFGWRKALLVDLHFSQDRAGNDTVCQVSLQLQHGQKEISAQEVQTDIFQAIERAITTATRSQERQSRLY